MCGSGARIGLGLIPVRRQSILKVPQPVKSASCGVGAGIAMRYIVVQHAEIVIHRTTCHAASDSG
jgi:hypothetical protein